MKVSAKWVLVGIGLSMVGIVGINRLSFAVQPVSAVIPTQESAKQSENSENDGGKEQEAAKQLQSLAKITPQQAQQAAIVANPGQVSLAQPENKVPTAISNVAEDGENIYDAAKANDWQQASAKLASLKNTANNLDSVIKSEDPNEDQLDDAIANLDRAVQGKDKLAAMRAANQVTLLATNLSVPFHPPVPVQVSLLDYYGRQLEIGVAANNTNQLQAIAKDVQKTWNELRSAIESKGATAEAQKFDNLVTQLQAASSTNDYSRLATAVLDGVDHLEKVFKL